MKMHMPILSTVQKAAQQGLRDVGRETLKRSRELSPSDSGGLKKEGRVNIDDLTVQVSYDSLKALVQHENLEYRHDDGQAKFLEDAASQVDVEAMIARRIRSALSG